MNKTIIVLALSLGISACAMEQRKVEKELKHPPAVNCATAQGDIRALQHEKANVAERMAEGVTSIAPAGIVVGVLSGTEGTKFEVATGEYNKMIDQRIAEIKNTCGL